MPNLKSPGRKLSKMFEFKKAKELSSPPHGEQSVTYLKKKKN